MTRPVEEDDVGTVAPDPTSHSPDPPPSPPGSPASPVAASPAIAPSSAVSQRTTIVGVTLLGWAILTIAELILGLRLWVSFTLTVLQTLAVPALTVGVLSQVRSDREDSDRSGLVRTLAVHAIILLLLAGCLFGKYLVIYEVLQDPYAADELVSSYETYGVAAFLMAVIGLWGSPSRISATLAAVADRPARLMASSFGLAAFLGTLLLALPVSLRNVADASLLNACFNAVSAVCVTGLAVGNVADTYSTFGQVVLFVLFQIGGLGIMSLSTFFAVLGGRRLQARRAKAMAELLDVDSFTALRRSLLGIVAVTFVIEAAGAGLLYIFLADHPDVVGDNSRVWVAVFHAVSAYCNAGFSNLHDGLYPFIGVHAISSVVVLLIVFGGIGFPVIFELLSRANTALRRRRNTRLSLHTRVVLWMSLLLWGGGAIAFLILESGGAMAELSWGERISGAIFQSVTCRTAGFSTVDFGAMGPAAWMVAGVLMFIGASPGSTGGGAKTTTLAAVFATLRAELRRGGQPTLGGRALSEATVRKAIAVTSINVVVVGVVVFLLLMTESHDPARIAFEAVSAVSTTGLSTGITSDLSSLGKLVVALGMFLGRIGPMTAALIVAESQSKQRYRLVEERIAIG